VFHDRDPDVVRENSEEKMVGKSFQITTPSPTRIKMVTLGMALNIADGIHELAPELIRKLF